MRRMGIRTVMILLTSYWFISQASSQTLVNDHLSLIHTATEFTPTPMKGGPAGTLTMTATFENRSLDERIPPEALTALTFVVTELTGGNLLLNADKGTGGVGSGLTVPFTGDYSDRLLSPGEHFSVDFLIGLASEEPFDFFVDALGASGDVQVFSLENIATVVQINSCQDCEGVEQQNLAFIFQEISTNNVFTYIPDLIKSNKGFIQKITNIASIIQENICIRCARVNQQNLVTIF